MAACGQAADARVAAPEARRVYACAALAGTLLIASCRQRCCPTLCPLLPAQALLLPEPLSAQLLREQQQRGQPGQGQQRPQHPGNGHIGQRWPDRQRWGGGGGGWRRGWEEQRRLQEQLQRERLAEAEAEAEVGTAAAWGTRSPAGSLEPCCTPQPGALPHSTAQHAAHTAEHSTAQRLNPTRTINTHAIPSSLPLPSSAQAAAGLWCFVNEQKETEGPYTVSELHTLHIK